MRILGKKFLEAMRNSFQNEAEQAKKPICRLIMIQKEDCKGDESHKMNIAINTLCWYPKMIIETLPI